MKTMKSLVLSSILAILTMFNTSGLLAQDAKTSELKITTSSVCKMCKKSIEKAVAADKGVSKSVLDVTSKVLTVNYDPAVTSPEKIRLAISNVGYDADEVKANPKAYKKLEDCCQKENAGKME